MQILQPLPLLARIVAEAGDMHIGTCILLLPLLHPVEVAEQIATLDHIAKGRLIFGIGLGYVEQEFHAFGIDKKTRVSRFEESLALIKQLWTEDEVHFAGKHFNIRGIQPTLRPVQQPHPPIWIAANNDSAVKRAARVGDAWYANPHATFDTIQRQMQVYQAALKEYGRPDPEYRVLMREIYIAKDRKTALAECRLGLEHRFQVYVQHGQDKEMPEGDEDFDLSFEELAKDRLILGSPEQCVEELKRYEALGFNYFVLDFHWPGLDDQLSLKNLRMLGEHVLPILK